MTALRTYLLLEVLIFAAASLLHRGLLGHGYQHYPAAVAEGLIGLVIAVGFAVAVYRPVLARTAASWSQGLALLGVAAGIVGIMLGFGPRTPLEYALHGVMLIVLIAGLLVARAAERILEL